MGSQVTAAESGLRPKASVGPTKRNMHNQKIDEHDSDWQLAPASDGHRVGEGRRGSRMWLFGAYTFLVVWSAAFLVLFFTNRLPV